MACLEIITWLVSWLWNNDHYSLLQVALDYIPKTGLSWIGNCNELNAGILRQDWVAGLLLRMH